MCIWTRELISNTRGRSLTFVVERCVGELSVVKESVIELSVIEEAVVELSVVEVAVMELLFLKRP